MSAAVLERLPVLPPAPPVLRLVVDNRGPLRVQLRHMDRSYLRTRIRYTTPTGAIHEGVLDSICHEWNSNITKIISTDMEIDGAYIVAADPYTYIEIL